MQIVRTTGGEYNDCIVKYFDLFDYKNDKKNEVMFWGWAGLDDEVKKSEYEKLNMKNVQKRKKKVIHGLNNL